MEPFFVPVTAYDLIPFPSPFLLFASCFKWKQAKTLNKNKHSSLLSLKNELERPLPVPLRASLQNKHQWQFYMAQRPQGQRGKEGTFPS